jgi:hypothetical protein
MLNYSILGSSLARRLAEDSVFLLGRTPGRDLVGPLQGNGEHLVPRNWGLEEKEGGEEGRSREAS